MFKFVGNPRYPFSIDMRPNKIMFMTVKCSGNDRVTINHRDQTGCFGGYASWIILDGAGTMKTNAIDWSMEENEGMHQFRMIGLRLRKYFVNPRNLISRESLDRSRSIHPNKAGIPIIEGISQIRGVCLHPGIIGNSRDWWSIGLNQVVLPLCWIRVVVIMVASHQEGLIIHTVTRNSTCITIQCLDREIHIFQSKSVIFKITVKDGESWIKDSRLIGSNG